MQLEQRDKELAAIGSAIGCNCRPCVDRHIPKGREAGLSEVQLADAVTTARAVRDQGIELLTPRIDELLGTGDGPTEPAPLTETSREHALAALGASIGVNSHPLLRRYVAAASEFGLSAAEIEAATKMASYVQKRAGEITADRVKDAVGELATIAAVGS